MFAALLLSISVVALAHFALYYCRAMLLTAASASVSDQVLAAAHVEDGFLSGQDFEALSSLYRLTPNVKGGGSGLGLVGMYRKALNAVRVVPALAAWSERELAICSRYAAVQVERRMQVSMALAAAARSY